MDEQSPETSPASTALSELERLRMAFREAVSAYVARIEADLDTVRDKLAAQAAKDKIPNSRMRDIRDMLTLLRNTQIKTEKGRRKDIKKMDSISSDLRMLVEGW